MLVGVKWRVRGSVGRREGRVKIKVEVGLFTLDGWQARLRQARQARPTISVNVNVAGANLESQLAA
jgi:hypothetical protein